LADDLEPHYRTVVRAFGQGRVVPLLGAGINLVGRTAGDPWVSGSQRLPSTPELATFLAHEFDIVDLVRSYEVQDLVRVAQTIATFNDVGPLYEKLHQVFDVDCEPTLLHRFLARLPRALHSRGSEAQRMLVLTTNYDDVLERTFREEREPYDLLWYKAEADARRGRFWHWPHDQRTTTPRLVELPNEYEVSSDACTVIVKFHGAVDRADSARDSYVITEDNYIDYLAQANVTSLLPPELVVQLKRSHFLFLAYALRDWNVRAILHRIWASQPLPYRSWAVQRDVHPVDRRLWQNRNVDIRDIDLGTYVRELAARMEISLP
jgi:hypothetical protein